MRSIDLVGYAIIILTFIVILVIAIIKMDIFGGLS